MGLEESCRIVHADLLQVGGPCSISATSNMANLAVLRNQGHSGSLWLTHLLNSELDVPAVSHEFQTTSYLYTWSKGLGPRWLTSASKTAALDAALARVP